MLYAIGGGVENHIGAIGVIVTIGLIDQLNFWQYHTALQRKLLQGQTIGHGKTLGIERYRKLSQILNNVAINGDIAGIDMVQMGLKLLVG
jgi:hypothetical protein